MENTNRFPPVASIIASINYEREIRRGNIEGIVNIIPSMGENISYRDLGNQEVKQVEEEAEDDGVNTQQEEEEVQCKPPLKVHQWTSLFY